MRKLATLMTALSFLVSLGFADERQYVRDEVYNSYRIDNGYIGGYLNRIFQRHEFDSHPYYPSFESLKNAHLPAPKKVRGTMTYAGRFVRKYAYDVLREDDTAVIEVRIHFRNTRTGDYAHFTKMLKKAADYWTQGIDKSLLSFSVQFRFLAEEDPLKAHFNVKTVSTSIFTPVHGPYDVRWSRDWKLDIMTHEIGHMLGLNDEYHYGSLLTGGLFDGCDNRSKMCSAKGDIQVNHSYFIFKRIIDEEVNE
tara:strand:- start:4196 stop:4948 length:753 start_codon:yes stop_codon:yes gene_type:complete